MFDELIQKLYKVAPISYELVLAVFAFAVGIYALARSL